jgi:hypothetical protein
MKQHNGFEGVEEEMEALNEHDVRKFELSSVSRPPRISK